MLSENLAFLVEIDRLKAVERQSELIGKSRRENSAEHSWHLAMCALVLASEADLDIFRVVKMLLVHDVVEIDAGDTPLHSANGPPSDKRLIEAAAAERIFGLLPRPQAVDLFGSWFEFEYGESPEAQFARALDKLQPLILNIMNGGGTWEKNGLDEATVVNRYGPAIAGGSAALWREVRELVREHFNERAGHSKG
jgi:putative hydrolases of HD superfamily